MAGRIRVGQANVVWFAVAMPGSSPPFGAPYPRSAAIFLGSVYFNLWEANYMNLTLFLRAISNRSASNAN